VLEATGLSPALFQQAVLRHQNEPELLNMAMQLQVRFYFFAWLCFIFTFLLIAIEYSHNGIQWNPNGNTLNLLCHLISSNDLWIIRSQNYTII
jgi:hypothetical protein